MQNQSQHQAVKNIYTMLSEMAAGNLSFRLQPCGRDNELDEIATLLNTTAEKIQAVLAEVENTEQHTSNDTIDTHLFQNIRRYILDNLLEPLPTAKELSHLFGINEFKLNKGFKQLFNTSIYRFYTEERLKTAYGLIKQTNLSLKEIAYSSGFNSYLNFSKAFKKKYQVSPGKINRPTKLE